MKKIIVSSDDLKQALVKIGNAIDADPVLPVLNNLYCKVTPGQIELIGTNTEITILYRLACEAKETFDFLLSHKFLTKIVNLNRHCPIEIEASTKVVNVKGPNDQYEIKVAEKLKDFPVLPKVPETNSFEFVGDVLRTLSTALDTTGKNPKKPELEFVLMELAPGKLTVASTDGSYVVFSKEFAYDHTLTEELLLSQKIIKTLSGDGLQLVKVFYTDKAIRFESDKLTVINTRVEYKFVNFRAIFPQEWPGNLTVTRSDLLQALVKCSLTDDQLHATRLDLATATEVKLTSDDHVLQVNVAVPISYTGEVKLTTVNSEKLLKLLNQIEDDEITMAIHDSKRAIILTLKDDTGYKGLIMPIASQQ